jgi:glycopeptide antibiotics resistance protein
MPIGAAALITAAIITLLRDVLTPERRTPGARAAYLLFARFLGLWYGLCAAAALFKLEAVVRILFHGGIRKSTDIFDGNIIPLKTIVQFIRQGNWYQLIGNALALVPLPLLLRMNFPRLRYRSCLCISLLAAAVIEPVQLLLNAFIVGPFNVVDIDDFLLNAAGALVGLLILWIILKFRAHSRKES